MPPVPFKRWALKAEASLFLPHLGPPWAEMGLQEGDLQRQEEGREEKTKHHLAIPGS